MGRIRLLKKDQCAEIVFVKSGEDTDGAPYAILSHTWIQPHEDEVTFQDLIDGTGRGKPGWRKLFYTLVQAQKDGVQYVWIDTCCIDKHNSPELGRSINLMYEWYASAKVCYVYLSDVNSTRFDWQTSFKHSKWFTRGWTLQELVAPTHVKFFDCSWRFIGTREDLTREMLSIRGIPAQLLQGQRLKDVSIVERLEWMKSRTTSEGEDLSYCLLGILGVKLLFNYGEGAAEARKRLLEKVATVHGISIADDLGRFEIEQTQHSPDLLHADGFSAGQLVKRLTFTNMDARRNAIDDPLRDTCHWLLNNQAYNQWKFSDSCSTHRVLWIKGHPGAGKSTILKFADLDAVRNDHSGTLQISFYFNARGSVLEHSTEGMYRSLLCQLFTEVPDMEEQSCKHLQKRQRRNLETLDLSLPQLKVLLQTVLETLTRRHIRCFVDALDECEVGEVEEMLYHFDDLAQAATEHGGSFSVCFASRYYPGLSIKHAVELRLDEQSQHLCGVKDYVHKRLNADSIPNATELQEQVVLRARGIFMWAVLVVKLLNKEIAKGSRSTLTAIIKRLPPELDGLYQAICKQDADGIEQFQTCMQLVLFARKPLTGHELYSAIEFATQGQRQGQTQDTTALDTMGPDGMDYTLLTTEEVGKYVAAASRGLAEVVPGAMFDIVQVIHESVRDYFLQRRRESLVPPDVGAERMESWCNDHIASICQRYMTSLISWTRSKSGELIWSDVSYAIHIELGYGFNYEPTLLQPCMASGSTFLLYSVFYIVHHAEVAALHYSQTALLKSIDWACLGELLYVEAPDWYSGTRILSSLCIHCNAPRVLRSAIEDCRMYRSELDSILWQASIFESPDVLLLLLDLGADPNAHVEDSEDADQNTLLMRAIEHGYESPVIASLLTHGANVNARGRDGTGRTALIQTIVVYHVEQLEVVELLLDRGASIDLADTGGRTALMKACEQHWSKGVVLLLDRGASIDLADTGGRTALMEACFVGFSETARLLIDRDASTNLADTRGRTALMEACKQEWLEAMMEACEQEWSEGVELLLDRGASIDLADTGGRTALMRACYIGFSETARLLVDRGASTNLADTGGRTALMEACCGEWSNIAELLLDRGASIDLADTGGRTALMEACYKGLSTIVKLLLDRGASIDLADTRGRTALMAACKFAWNDIIPSMLLDHGANVSTVDNKGRTALIWAVRSKECKSAVVRLLLSKGADPGTKDIKGKTAIMQIHPEGVDRDETFDILTRAIRVHNPGVYGELPSSDSPHGSLYDNDD